MRLIEIETGESPVYIWAGGQEVYIEQFFNEVTIDRECIGDLIDALKEVIKGGDDV